MACAEEYDRTQREYEDSPSHGQRFGLHLSLSYALRASGRALFPVELKIYTLLRYQERRLGYNKKIYFQLQSGSELFPEFVSCFWLLPSASISQTCVEPERVD